MNIFLRQEVFDGIEKQMGHVFLNLQPILTEVNTMRPTTTYEEENALVISMKHAKKSLEMQADPEADELPPS